MTAFIIRRLLQAVVVVLLVTLIVFALVHLVPGDPVLQILGPYAEPEAVEQLRDQLGLDKPIHEQYLSWLGDLSHGDLGKSLITQQPVARVLKHRVAATAQVALGSLAVALLLGIPLGVVAAVSRNRWPDALSSILAIMGVTMPSFWLAIMLIVLFSVRLGWLPTGGYVSPTTDLAGSIKRSILPWFVGGWALSAVLMRQMRSALLEVLGQDYIRTARAKGLTELITIWRHALKNALIPIVTLLGLGLGHILGGSVIIEVIFGIPGMGRLLVDALFQKDYPIIQGIVLVVALSVVFVNLLVDIAYGWLDPRIRYG